MEAMDPQQPLEKILLQITNGGAECEIYLLAGDMKHRASTGPLAPLLDQLDSVREQYSITASEIVLEPRTSSPERGAPSPSGWKGGILKRTKSGKKRGRKSKRGGFKQEDVPAWFTRATVEKAFHLLHSLELLELPARLARDLDQVHEKAKTAEPYERASLETSQVTFEREFAKAMLVANCAGYRPEDVAPVKSFAEEFKGRRLWAACQAFETECATALSRLPAKAAKQAEAPPASFPANQIPVFDDDSFNETEGSAVQEHDTDSTHKDGTDRDQVSGVKAPATPAQENSLEKVKEGTDAETPVSSTAEGKQELAQAAVFVVAGAAPFRGKNGDANGVTGVQESQEKKRAVADSAVSSGTGATVVAKPEGREKLPAKDGPSQTDVTAEAHNHEHAVRHSAGSPTPVSNFASKDEPAEKERDSSHPSDPPKPESVTHEKVSRASAPVAAVRTHAPGGFDKPSVSDVEAASQGSQDDLFDIEPGMGSSSPVLPSSPARGGRPMSWSDEEGEIKLARHSYEGLSAINAAAGAFASGDQSRGAALASETPTGSGETRDSVSAGKKGDEGAPVDKSGLGVDAHEEGPEATTGLVSVGQVGISEHGPKEPTMKTPARTEERPQAPVAAPKQSGVTDIDRLWLATKDRLFNLPDRDTGRFVPESVPREERERDVASHVSEAGSSSQSGKTGHGPELDSSQGLGVGGSKAGADGNHTVGGGQGALPRGGDSVGGGHDVVSDVVQTGSLPAVQKAGKQSPSISRKGAAAAGLAVAGVGGVAAVAALAATQAPRGNTSVAADPVPAAKHPSSGTPSSEPRDTALVKPPEALSVGEDKAPEASSLHAGSDPATQVQTRSSRSYDKPWLSHAALPATNGALPGVDARKAESGAKDGDRRASEGRARRESMSSYKERRQAKMKEQEERIRGEHEAKLKALEDALEKRKAEMAERSRRSALLATAAANRRAAHETGAATSGTPEEDKAQARERLRKYRSDKGLSSAEPSPPAGSRVNQLLAKLGNMVGNTPTGQEASKATEGADNGSSPRSSKRLAANSFSRSQDGQDPSGVNAGAKKSPRGPSPGAESAWARPRSQSTPRTRSGGASGVAANKIALPVGEQEFARSVSPGRGSIVRTPEALQGNPSPARPPLSALGPGQASPGRASLATTPRSAASPYPSPRGPLTGRSSPKSGGWNKPETNPPFKTPLAEVRTRGTETAKRSASVSSKGGSISQLQATPKGGTFGRSPRQSAPVTPGTTRRAASVGTFGGSARSSSPGTFGRAARSDIVSGGNKTGQAASKFVRPTSASTVHRRVEVLPEGAKAGKTPGNSRGVFQPKDTGNGQKATDAAKPAWSSGVRVTVTDSSASKPSDRFGNRTALPPTPKTSRPWRVASAVDPARRSSVLGTPRSMSTSAVRPAIPEKSKRAFGPGGSHPPIPKTPLESRPRRARHSIAAIPQSPTSTVTPRRSSGGWGAATSARDTVKVPAKAETPRAAPRTSSYLLSPKDRLLSQTKASQAKQAERALPGAAEPGPKRSARRSISGPVQAAGTPGGQTTRRVSSASVSAGDSDAPASADAEIVKTVQPASGAVAGDRDVSGDGSAEGARRVKPRLNGMGPTGEAGEEFRRLKGGFVEEWVRGTSREGAPQWVSDAVELDRAVSGEPGKQISGGPADSVERMFGEEIVEGTEQRTDANARQQKLPTLLQARPNGNSAGTPTETSSGDFEGVKIEEKVGGGENGAMTKDDVDVLSTPKLRKRWEGPVEPLVIQKSPGDGGGALGKLGKLFSRKATNGTRADAEASPAK